MLPFLGLQEVVWVFLATSEGWKHACEHLEPQIFIDIVVHRLIGFQQPVGRGSIGAQIMHAFDRFAEASAITEMRLVTCKRFQESQAFSENPITMQKAVVRITVCNSADTVKRFSIIGPQGSAIWAKNSKHLDSAPAVIIRALRNTDSLRNVERPQPSSLPGTRKPIAR